MRELNKSPQSYTHSPPQSLSRHLPSITRKQSIGINERIAALSSDQKTFEETARTKQNAHKHSNFDHDVTYTEP